MAIKARKYRTDKGETRWQARWVDPSGKVKGKSFATKREADSHMANMRVSLRTGNYVDPAHGKMTVSDWWGSYRKTTAWAALRPSTQAAQEVRMENHVIPHIGGKQVGSLNRLDVEGWLAILRGGDMSHGYLDSIYRTLAKVLQGAEDAGVIARNPAARFKLPAAPEQEIRPLTVSELEALADAVPLRYRVLILTLGWTGLRIGEASALRVSNLDLLRKQVRVVEAYAEVKGQLILGPCKTKGSNRVVSLPGFLVEELAQHLSHFPSEGLVFTAPKGGAIKRTRFRKRVWLPALEQTGLDQLSPAPRLHDLRHTAVSLAIATGANPKEIQARAGHSSITLTMDRYGHLFEGQDQVLAEKLDLLRQQAL